MIIITEPDTTKKRIIDFDSAVKSITYKRDFTPIEIDPDFNQDVNDSILVSVKTDIIIKSKNQKKLTKALLKPSSKRVFEKLANNHRFNISIEDASVNV